MPDIRAFKKQVICVAGPCGDPNRTPESQFATIEISTSAALLLAKLMIASVDINTAEPLRKSLNRTTNNSTKKPVIKNFSFIEPLLMETLAINF
jgi:hypothetical protein